MRSSCLGRILLPMPSANDLTPESGRFVALFVGKSGVGKTPAAGSFVKEGRVHFFDFDLRMRGLLGCPWIDRQKITYDSYPAANIERDKKGQMVVSAGVDLLFNRLNKDLASLQIQAQNKSLPYKTIVIDSLGQEAYLLLKDAQTFTKTNNLGPIQADSFQGYQFQNMAVKDVLTFFLSIPHINIIVNSHIVNEYEKEDPEEPMSKNIIVGQRLTLTDKLSEEIPGKFDHIFEFSRDMSGDDPRFYVRFWGDIARTVFPGMPRGQVDITNKDFYEVFTDLKKQGAEKAKDQKGQAATK